jgi:uncharacterized protein YkwD
LWYNSKTTKTKTKKLDRSKKPDINRWIRPVLRTAFVVFSAGIICWPYQPTMAADNLLIGQEQAIIAQTNQIRERVGLPPLGQNSYLTTSASRKAADMASRGYFDHGNPDGYRMAYWINGAGYTYTLAGENIAKGFSSLDRLMNAWVNSPAHYKNLVEPKFTEIGIGMAEGWYENQNTLFIVQHFGAPVAPAIPNITELTASLVSKATPLMESLVNNNEQSAIIKISPTPKKQSASAAFNADSVPSIPTAVSYPLIAVAQAQSVGSEPPTTSGSSSGEIPFWPIFALIGLAIIGYLDEFLPLWVGRIRPTSTR